MSDDSHFQKFVRVYDDLEQALTSPTYLDPAFPVVSNPIVGLSNAPSNPTDQTGAVSPESVSLITDPNSIQAMNFFSDCYQSMLVMLNTFFATYSQGGVPEPRPQAALFYAAFFPLMTMVIRPMGEIIAHMPAGDGFPHQNAGANFDINSPVTIEPTYEWCNERLESLIKQAFALIDIVPPRDRERMRFLWENLTSTRIHLGTLWIDGK